MAKLYGVLIFSVLTLGIMTGDSFDHRLCGQEMTFDDALELAGQAFESNWAKIQSGEGMAKIHQERTILKPYPKLERTVPDVPQPPGEGVFQADVRCYFQGDVFRNDYESSKPEPGVKELFFQRKEREVNDPEKRIYYDLIGGYAYINDPYLENFSRINVGSWFEPRAYLKMMGEKPSHEALSGEVQYGGKSSPPKWKEVNGKRLLELEVIASKRRVCRAYLDPELGWLMTRYEVQDKDLKHTYLYQVEYVEHPEGIWFPKKVEWEANFGYFVDHMVAEYCNFRLNCQLPLETFTFKGLGVPPGTLLIDKRGGAELTYYYGRLPEKKMEKLLEDVVDFEKKLDMGLEEAEAAPKVAEASKPGGGGPSPAAAGRQVAASLTTSRVGWLVLILVVFLVIVAIGASVFLVSRKKRKA